MTDKLIGKIDILLSEATQRKFGFEKPKKQIDMMGKKCRGCGKGKYKETSPMDDIAGVLHCPKCRDRIDRYVTEAAMGKVFVGSATYGKEKSKAWFKYRGLIQGVKTEKELTALMHKMAKEVKGAELQDLTNQALEKLGKLK